MKKTLSALSLAIVIFTTTYSSNSHALVNLAFKNKTLKSIGGIGALGGATVGTAGLIVAKTAAVSTASGVVWTIIAVTYGYAIAGLGLILLDDNEIADIEFQKIDLTEAKNFEEFTPHEITIYNSEVDMLNAIRQTIVSEVDATDDTTDAEQLWEIYSHAIHPTTFEIAKAKAKLFVEKM